MPAIRFGRSARLLKAFTGAFRKYPNFSQLRHEVDAIAHNDEMRAVLQREQSWLAQAERTVAEVREWREREARQFWLGLVRRWLSSGRVVDWLCG